MPRKPKAPKPKAVNFQLIPVPRDHDELSEPYRVLRDMRAHHDHIWPAKIALAWRYNWQPDRDGHLTLGQACKASDLSRELADFDFIIFLNHHVWHSPEFDGAKKRALVDHELCHCTVSLDRDGEQKIDERGRLVWRIRRHDLEEFRDVVRRHGCYRYELELFAAELVARQKMPLMNGVNGGES